MNKRITYSPEVRERAVRMVLTSEHEHSSRWAALVSIASKIGCTPETLRSWVNKMEVDSGKKPGVTSEAAARMKELERENKELKQANELLKKAALAFLICLFRFNITKTLLKLTYSQLTGRHRCRFGLLTTALFSELANPFIHGRYTDVHSLGCFPNFIVLIDHQLRCFKSKLRTEITFWSLRHLVT
ncbi:MAG: hypothetical protein COB75_03290 [Idiomarina sp.]|nr:hypothetical protein [Idiomarinaceae bacterium]PHQ77436.1 MAG: hypothetical protein COB75_03290 [Idiomarina sp.]HAD47702.1 hypothetical protein [Idiomarina sp.]